MIYPANQDLCRSNNNEKSSICNYNSAKKKKRNFNGPPCINVVSIVFGPKPWSCSNLFHQKYSIWFRKDSSYKVQTLTSPCSDIKKKLSHVEISKYTLHCTQIILNSFFIILNFVIRFFFTIEHFWVEVIINHIVFFFLKRGWNWNIKDWRERHEVK